MSITGPLGEQRPDWAAIQAPDIGKPNVSMVFCIATLSALLKIDASTGRVLAVDVQKITCAGLQAGLRTPIGPTYARRDSESPCRGCSYRLRGGFPFAPWLLRLAGKKTMR